MTILTAFPDLYLTALQALVAWFYGGQEAVKAMVQCSALGGDGTTGSETSTAEGGH
jgi:hypothetical protein